MPGFDIVFALFSLLLGLSVTEVLGRFAGVLKLQARARAGHAAELRVGLLTPLLAVLVMLNQLSFWMTAFAVRQTLPFGYFTLLGVLAVVGGYYLLSTLVFPDDPAVWPDFDDYYDQQKRFVLSGMLLLNATVAVAQSAFHPPVTAAQQVARDGGIGTAAALGVLLALILFVWLIRAKGRRTNAALMVALIALNLGGAALVVTAGL